MSIPAQLKCVVVIPARNEAKRILQCLEAIRCQWSSAGRMLHDQVLTIVVVNGTTDQSGYQVEQWMQQYPELATLLVNADFTADQAHVGSARRLGLQLGCELLERFGKGPDTRQMLLSTDADSRLAHDALARGVNELTRVDAFGAHIIAGEADHSRIGLTVNRYNLLKGQLRHHLYPNEFDRDAPHGTFGGAGFGVSLQAYREVGGLPALPFDEDQYMRRRLLDAGFRVSYPTDIVVYTSTRLTGRTPWGMAKQLAAWEDQDADHWPLLPSAAGLVAKYRLKQQLRKAWIPASATESFEQFWTAYWRNPYYQTQHASTYPPVDVRIGIRQLEDLLEAPVNRQTSNIKMSVELMSCRSLVVAH